MAEGETLAVVDWLRALHLEQYASQFEERGLERVAECQSLDEGQLLRMGVLLPGHRKRILSGLQKASSSEPPPGPALPCPEAPPRPVPMKRNIFRRVGPAPTPACNPDPCLGPSLPPALGTTPGPPPIPPRKSCQPPVKFSCLPPASEPGPATLRVEDPSGPPVTLPPEDPREPGVPVRPRPSLPPLPAKRHQVENKGPPPPAPPVPSRPPHLPPRGLPPKELTSFSAEVGPQTPELSGPWGKPPPPPPPVVAPQPPPKVLLLTPEFDDSDYDDLLEQEQSGAAAPASTMTDQGEEPQGGGGPRAVRFFSLLSEDGELSDEDDHAYEDVANDNVNVPTLSPPQQSSAPAPGGPPPHCPEGMAGTPTPPTPVIKAGWLDKNPPQGTYIYQKRWVKLDSDYLRYFDSDKDAYSKRFIPVSSISRVATTGDQKFEVITHNRTFAFRAESDAERKEWMQALQQVVDEQRARSQMSQYPLGFRAPENPDKAGSLELRGVKPKLYVVVMADKVLLYKNLEDYHQGIGITAIEMNVGNVKDGERRGFDLTTPYRIFSFSAESEAEKDEWLEAMRTAIAEALSTSEVAEQIWEAPANRYCADCGAAQPDWASINLCVAICKRCAGEHRGLGPSISKVRSLKMDRKVWTEELIELFHHLGNEVGNRFWAANVPPSEALDPTSSSQERRHHLESKYREGKYRRFHQLFGHQEELNRALCAAVTTSDLAETQALIFCGAEVSCFSGDPAAPTPLDLAEQAGQRLQMEFLRNNRTSETPRLNTGGLDKHYSVTLPSVNHSGFLYKTASVARPQSERRSREEFSRRWCTLSDGSLNYYENDRVATPSGEIQAGEIVCLVFHPPDTHGLEHTFEVYTEGERLYLFGVDNVEQANEWVKCIAKLFVPPWAERLLQHDFERLGRLPCKGGLSLERPQEGWFALAGSLLYAVFPDSGQEEALHLQKLQELSIQGEGEELVLVERRRTLYIHGERKLDFAGWVSAIQKAAGSSGDTLSQQQLGDSDIPVIVYRCVDYLTQCGLTSEGLYRKCGQTSKTQQLLNALRQDARSVRLKEGEQHVDDVSSALKRFFRDLPDGLFTRTLGRAWLDATGIEDEQEKIARYQDLLAQLPPVNRATVKALINHLYCVQCFSDSNQMTTHNLAIVFGPTLFQTDGQDYKAGLVVEDLISHYVVVFNVDERELRKQREEITAIIKMRVAGSSSGTQHAGDFICTVYLEEKKTEAEQHVKIPAAMTAGELVWEILDRRKVGMKDKDYWSCFEVSEREEAGITSLDLAPLSPAAV
ncbi:arf-GAP with Rho-GAP domain, ANK repeat and PH domain-containing protein 1 isoform X3 [Tachyglossus aculeatus]|uniref:arf-GAP with Rho-GAP domain, ANK repeat and PH domain-containing protein 1 isoform X3 n=1 Tax=Tachyglossus aculeatus TaxID=9261 RepID=UPI0018F66300|nr:arf-GAP with Rho-GAP domain, ANK repeat and PH domain-containing protein 1 isoform X3 [Tachyglossus aculeatus]